MAIIKYLCLSAVPAAAITSLAIHFLIEYKQIGVIDDANTATKAHATIAIVETTNQRNNDKMPESAIAFIN